MLAALPPSEQGAEDPLISEGGTLMVWSTLNTGGLALCCILERLTEERVKVWNVLVSLALWMGWSCKGISGINN